MERAAGVDVSHWTRVQSFADIPPEVVIFGAKATEGEGVTDTAFEFHRDGARARGFDLLAWYHVARPGDPVAQAQRLADLVGPLQPGECLVLDTERGSRVDVPFIEAFYNQLDEMGLSTPHDLYYGSAGVWTLMQARGWPRAANGRVGLWAPRYKSGDAPPHLPPPWTDWRLWQWTDGGQTGDPYSCPGIGPCDASWFNGDRDVLLAFVAGAETG